MTLRPYQRDAVEAIAVGLADGGRGQLHAACGSGKTRMSIEAATRLVPDAGLLVVLTPSLALVAQTITEWRSLARTDRVLAVCSDDTVTDAPAHLDDIPAHTTTVPEEIAAWIRQTSGRRLIVGTYLSADRLAEALREAGKSADLVIHDEAHHLAGRADMTTRRILDPQVLPALRRLFMTATPRIDDVRKDLSGHLSMSDTETFGPVLYSYPWARAISDGYLDDYRIVVMGVTQHELMNLLQDDERNYVDGPGGAPLRLLAAQAILARTASRYGLRRVIAFCHRLETAREFCRTLPSTLSRMPPASRPAGPLHTDRITGDHTHAERETILDNLREPPGGPDAWTVLTNVRCLSEGVDVPAVDAVLFAHPKTSQVDIVQAVGRALRRSASSAGTATVIVPIVVPDSAEEIADLDPGEYRVLWQIVRALRAHDESLGIELNRERTHLSRSNPQLPSKITVEMPHGAAHDALAALTALTIRQTTSAWWEGYGHAQNYAAAHGDLEVAPGHVTDDGFALGTWIQNARQHRRKGWLRPDRVAALDELGMMWDTKALTWERFANEMRTFREQFGHSLVPQQYVTPDGYPLGTRVNSARQKKHRLPGAIRAALDDLGMVWDTRDLRWQELYAACQQYAAQHGHLDVPNSYTTPDGYTLGTRLKRIRRQHTEGSLDPAERVSLEELGMEFSPAGDRTWNEFLAACDRYIHAHGSLATVTRAYVDPRGYRLGDRILYYRNLNNGTKPGGIPAQRREALDERGMVWRVAPVGELTGAQAQALRALSGVELGAEILRLVDEEGVMQSSIAEALGTHRSYLNTKIKAFRETGVWPGRQRSQKPGGLTGR